MSATSHSKQNVAAHTPGPWRALRHNADRPGLGWILEAGTNYVIGRVSDGVEEVDPYTHIPIRLPECDANARLIAAAPDLLAALEALLEWPAAEGDYSLRQPDETRAREAIAKARSHATTDADNIA